MRTLLDYISLIPPLNASDPNFMAEVALVMAPFVDTQALLASMPGLFDLDQAVGVQLDATGAWIGRSRKIPIPVPNPWFSFGVQGLGFGQGWWKGPYEGIALTSLDDDTYRRLLYAVRLANSCDGTQSSINAALQVYFNPDQYVSVPLDDFEVGVSTIGGPTTLVFVIDNTDYPSGDWDSMNLIMTIGIAGVLPNIVDLSILAQGLIPIQPAEVGINWAVTTVSGSPVFGFGVENEYISGFGVGAWGQTPQYVIDNVIL